MQPHDLNENIFEILIQKNRLQIMQYCMGLTGVRNKVLKNKEILYSIVWWLSEKCNQLMVKYMLNVLELNQIKLKQMQSENDQIDDHVIAKLLDCINIMSSFWLNCVNSPILSVQYTVYHVILFCV